MIQPFQVQEELEDLEHLEVVSGTPLGLGVPRMDSGNNGTFSSGFAGWCEDVGARAA